MIIDRIKDKVKGKGKRIVLPESNDLRVVMASIEASKDNISKVILIGDKTKIEKTFNIDLLDVLVINPLTYEKKDILIEKLYNLRKDKGMTYKKAQELIETDNMYFACMLVLIDEADGIVSGAIHSTSDTLRVALQLIKGKRSIVSSFFLMEVPNCSYGEKGIFVFSDAGLVANPTSEELASIAALSAESFTLLTGYTSKVAFLSYSTYGSAKGREIDKVKEAVNIARNNYPELICDGELQLDAAIDKDVAKKKCPTSKVAGYANTLIFPNLEAGNIGYKLVNRLAKALSYGPITQGMNKPVNDLSRGCTKDDIVGVIAITALQALENEKASFQQR